MFKANRLVSVVAERGVHRVNLILSLAVLTSLP